MSVRHWFAGAIGLASAIAVCASSGSNASADTALRYGWWAQTNQGAITAPPPPDVPPDGMFAQNSPQGPLAYSALTFAIPAGATGATLTLVFTGNPVITEAPEACLATSSFDQTENGPWSARPSYDCTADVFGETDSNNTSVTFSVMSLVRDGELSIVILAGGQADRFAMNAPSATALTVATASPPITSGTAQNDLPPGVPQPTPGTPSQIGTASSPFGTTSSPFESTTSQAVLAPANVAAPTPSGSSRPPLLAPSQNPPSVAATVLPRARPASNTQAFSAGGLALLLIAIVYWADGFGALPLRSRLLVAQRRST